MENFIFCAVIVFGMLFRCVYFSPAGNFNHLEAVVHRCSVKNMFLEISQNSKENSCARVSFLIKLQPKGCNLIKTETLAQMFSCEFYEISKKTYFTEYLRMTSSVRSVSVSSQ